MITPVKHKSVNWVDGMKISSEHFVHADQTFNELLRDASSLRLNRFNFGLLPPFQGENLALDAEIVEKATNHITVKVKQCNAITEEGYRIDIPPGRSTDSLALTHAFDAENPDSKKKAVYHILLTVNPFTRVPVGEPDPGETPPRYPYTDKEYQLAVLPATQVASSQNSAHYLIIGRVWIEGGSMQIDQQYIPPCTAVISHPALIRYHELFAGYLNDLQITSFRILDKISSKDSVSAVGKNVKSLCDDLLAYIAGIFFSYRNQVPQAPPVVMVNYFSSLAHVFFTSMRSINSKEREELLKYFYEWRDVTPGNFEELLSQVIELEYDHHDIRAALVRISGFLQILVALWNKLSALEYVGQRKENIVVAEQQLVQQVQTKRTWTLLD